MSCVQLPTPVNENPDCSALALISLLGDNLADGGEVGLAAVVEEVLDFAGRFLDLGFIGLGGAARGGLRGLQR